MEIFDYDNILLLPRKCRVQSRGECDTSIEFGGRRFLLPVVPANMKTVVDEPISQMLAESGHFYVMHRFDLDAVAFARRMRDRGLFVSISSGVKPADFAMIDQLAADGVGADYITIDIAHGHSESVHQAILHIKQRLPQAFVIAGNVATPEAVIDLENWGADATKVGVGPGKVCITKLKTGFGTGGWQLSALKWCARVATKPIIADGGIRHHGDIAKSVRFGAAMVMVGSLFAGHEESPVPRWKSMASATRSTTAAPATSTRASTNTLKASASWSPSRATCPTRCARCAKTCKAPSAMPAGAC
jgi:GMP reductase